MEKFKCPHGEKNVSADYIHTRCVTRCGYEQLLKCLKEAEEERTDEFVVQPFIVSPNLYLLKGLKGACEERSWKCWE